MYSSILRPLLFRFNSDTVHESTIKWASFASRSKLCLSCIKALYDYQAPALKQEIAGLAFRNPVGLAAGFDKNGTLVPLMEALGFGFTEVGSITASANTGNPKPRSFRLPKDLSLINRMGLNNDGAATVTKRLKNYENNIPIGINIAKTNNPEISGEDALEDYRTSFLAAVDVADYITINISCPNTEEGKTFEEPETLSALLAHLEIGKDLTQPPVFVKFSADIESVLLEELIDITRHYSVNGYVISNTSSLRDGLTTPKSTLKKIGRGGLSGSAIREKSTRLIRLVHRLTRGEKPIIGVGGILTVQDALEKIRAGADLIQIYTGMVYEGPGLVQKINKGIVRYLREEGLEHVYQIRKKSPLIES